MPEKYSLCKLSEDQLNVLVNALDSYVKELEEDLHTLTDHEDIGMSEFLINEAKLLSIQVEDCLGKR